MGAEPGTTAPSPLTIQEQSAKVESAFSDVVEKTGQLTHRKPSIEDYVFYAEAQRAQDRLSDGKTHRGVAEKLHDFARGLLPVAADPSTVGSQEQISGLGDLEIEKVNAWRAL